MKGAPLVGACLSLALLTSGCDLGSGLYNADLPGGADLGDHPYSVTVQFTDALDLVPQAGVKVNDVAVGRVSSIDLEKGNGKIADVTVQLNGDVALPANAVASIQQTSLLGEKYVALSKPTSGSTGRLLNHAVIPVARTSDGVEVEQVLGALSLLLNGGGIGQLHDIYLQLNAFQAGNQDQIRTFFSSVNRVIGVMNSHRSSITSALDALARLSGALKSKNSEITRLLAGFAPGIAELSAQRKQIIGALNSLNRLSTVTVATLDASKDDIVGDLRQLAPILHNLAAAGDAFPRSLQVLLTYPFTDAAVAGIKGDYLNSFITEVLNTHYGTPYVPTSSPVSSGTYGADSSTPPTIEPPTGVVTPAGLLPATTSAAPGLPGTLSLSAASSTKGRGSSAAAGSTSPSARAPGSASGSATAPGSTAPSSGGGS